MNITRIKDKFQNRSLTLPRSKPRVVVAMSGGVDSSVAAALLKQAGYDVVGVFMQFWFPAGEIYGENRCCSLQSFNEARAVADILMIPIYKLNFGAVFKKVVVDEFLNAYRAGQTPNPCVSCNKFIKFDLLWRQARAIFKADYLATGHYVRTIKIPKHGKHKTAYQLLRGRDKRKDQSYFLYNLNQKLLAHLLFPIGSYTKPRVRELAKAFNLPVYDKKDSQEVCFVGQNYNEFLKKYLRPSPGKIITFDNFISSIQGEAIATQSGGWEIGEHRGLPFYTLGQREGIGLSGGPWYVCGSDRYKNQLIVTRDQKHSAIFQKELICQQVNWLKTKPKFPWRCQAQIRYHAKPAICLIKPVRGGLKVKFISYQRAIMPGQSIVFYQGQELMGGGIIKNI